CLRWVNFKLSLVGQFYIAGDNQQWELMAGLKQSDNAFAEFSDAIYEDDKDMVHQALENLVENNVPFNIEFRLNRPDGSTIWLWDRGRISEYDEHGNPVWVVGITLEVTESKQSQLKIESLAYYDQLTGLPNRRLMEKQLNKLIELPSLTTSYSALLFIDLDRFKLLNDSFGHLMGDKLLKAIASRLNHINNKDGTIARFGGDEFIILLPNLHSEHAQATQLTRQFADTIVTQISKQVNLRNEVLDVEIDYCITASIGGIIFNANTVNSDEIQQLADMAMYRTKAAGGNAAIIFDLAMQNELRKTSELSLAMLNSMVDKDFCIYLQPTLNTREELIGAEVLIRWHHPTLGILEPDSFIDLAEESGFILHIGRYVLEQACIQLQRWQANEASRHLQLSLNLSSKQIIQGSFCQDLIEIVEAYNIDQSKLILEVTESMLIPDIKDATEKLTQLRSYGVSISLDDFGTGYSSLNYLRAFPIDELKIDRSFVMDVENNAQARVMVRSIIELASNLNLKIVAEGVETRNQIEILREFGVHIFQGFYFSKPITTAEFYAKYGLMS
ncbi:putative bifunctional diguanylate cyclase/phosphodiesterase, partial [Alteromonas sp. 14N.309.X.WAT.G.H12]|uniref:putative bifunctional diguanylate cyclase/phosphodiesterase n=1 Tax=Alteromonas sp. 14N.309.X.WAT.G.H12 TaxID=3120824 RepID=UPI002FD47C06